MSVDEEIKVERHQDIGGDISYNVTPGEWVAIDTFCHLYFFGI